MVASLTLGSVDISFSTIVHTLLGNVQTTDEMVIWNIRFPRNIVGALVGANLAVSGAILQAVMKNPLADPGIVGVSSGAGLAGVIMLIFMPEASILLTPVAFVGAMLSAAAVYALAWKNGIRPTRIILAGVAVSAFLGSGISALLVFYSDKVQGALLWMVGGLSARSWPQVETLFPYTILGLVLALAGCKALTILSLGDETARGLGVPVERVRFSMTAVAALFSGRGRQRCWIDRVCRTRGPAYCQIDYRNGLQVCHSRISYFGSGRPCILRYSGPCCFFLQ